MHAKISERYGWPWSFCPMWNEFLGLLHATFEDKYWDCAPHTEIRNYCDQIRSLGKIETFHFRHVRDRGACIFLIHAHLPVMRTIYFLGFVMLLKNININQILYEGNRKNWFLYWFYIGLSSKPWFKESPNTFGIWCSYANPIIGNLGQLSRVPVIEYFMLNFTLCLLWLHHWEPFFPCQVTCFFHTAVLIQFETLYSIYIWKLIHAGLMFSLCISSRCPKKVNIWTGSFFHEKVE